LGLFCLSVELIGLGGELGVGIFATVELACWSRELVIFFPFVLYTLFQWNGSKFILARYSNEILFDIESRFSFLIN
jgi:hypothetical protein